jgi:hypothetical protein
MNTIYLKRGQNMDITVEFRDEDGVIIELDETWAVTAAMKPTNTCIEPTSLTCTIQDGKALILQPTDDLSHPNYTIDIIADDNTDREISDVFYLNLAPTITPLT